MLRLRAGLVGILRPDQGIIHGAAQVRSHGPMVQVQRRAAASLGQLAAHGQLRDVFARQEAPCRAVVDLQHGKQKMSGVCFLAAHAARKLHGLVQQKPRFAREPFVSVPPECFPNAHDMLLAVLFHTQQSIGQMGGKKSAVFVTAAKKSAVQYTTLLLLIDAYSSSRAFFRFLAI